MEVYLDNAATTKLLPEVIEEIKRVSEFIYGNPSSVHNIGLKAEKIVKDTRKRIADSLDVEPEELYFTSGATESNNTAIFGTVYANKRKGNHIITSKIEHPSVLACFERLEKEGFDVTYLNVDKNGIIDLNELENSINEKTILVSIMTVNNELGSIQPIKEVARLKNKHNFIFHTDAVQAYMKIPSYMFDIADIISISGHKIHALKGIGAIAVKKNIKINPFMLGGGQERGFRSGTENVVGIASLGKAVEKGFNPNKVLVLRDMLKKGLESIEGVSFNCYNSADSAPHILNVTFKGKRGEVILHMLEENGVYVSTGSACHSNKFGESHVLKAIGLSKEDIGATVRFSFSEENTEDEIKYAINLLKNNKL
jgi:cysteine desulfurase